MSLYDKVMATADELHRRTDSKPILGFVLGSGLGGLGDALEDARGVPYGELEHVPRSKVPGHAGRFVAGRAGGVEVAVLSGRSHWYEGHDIAELTIPIRALIALGCKAVVVTNAAGGIHTEYRPGDLMAIVDHINCQWTNPLRGPNDDRLGPRFVDMSHTYDRALRQLLHKAAASRGMHLHDGVYAAISGPSYETPAEIRMLRVLGADAIGMSTVHEVIAARHMGAAVAGISLISNLAAGIEDKGLSHEEVTATAAAVAGQTVGLLQAFIPLAAEAIARG